MSRATPSKKNVTGLDLLVLWLGMTVGGILFCFFTDKWTDLFDAIYWTGCTCLGVYLIFVRVSQTSEASGSP